jgi:hypothetical protein
VISHNSQPLPIAKRNQKQANHQHINNPEIKVSYPPENKHLIERQKQTPISGCETVEHYLTTKLSIT